MADSNSFFLTWRPRVLSILRIIVGFLFMTHGMQKLFNYPFDPTIPSGFFPAPLFSLIGVAGILELVGGLLILLGLFTRPVAFILSGMMAVAYFTGHAKNGFWPLVNKGELAALYCFVFLYFSVAGGGQWSLDYKLRRRE